uniref:Jumonji domain containing 8 n=1 Tax=Mus musculus TaxID=10090 RepID=F6Q269_MOUSE
MAAAGRRGLLLLFVLWMMVTVILPASGEGGWKQNGLGIAAAVMEEERCTVERRAHITYSEFMQHYAFLKPVILQGLTDNSKFRALCSRENLLASFGDNIVRLSTANTYSYQKVDLPFQEYVEQLLQPQDPASLGNALLSATIPSPGNHPCLQLWNCRSWIWGTLPLAWAWFLRGYLWSEALVPLPS